MGSAYDPARVWLEMREPTSLRDCPNCGGTGRMSAFVVADQTPDKSATVLSWTDGRMRTGFRVWADCPVCNGNARAAFLTRMCGLEKEDLDVRLDDYFPHEGKREARAEIARLLAMTPNPAGFTSFVGGFGKGKSYALKALVNGFRLSGILSVYIQSMGDLLASVREMFGRDSSDAADTLIARYKGYRVLAIDECEKFNPTPWAKDVVFRVINYRYNLQSSYLTLLASNTHPREMDEDTLGYLASRMNGEREGARLIVVSGEDMRQ